jgi:hypothetical protein
MKFYPSLNPHADKSKTALQIFMKFRSRGFYKTLWSYLRLNKIGQKLGPSFMKTSAPFSAPSNLPDTPREEKVELIVLYNNEQRIFRALCCPISGRVVL